MDENVRKFEPSTLTQTFLRHLKSAVSGHTMTAPLEWLEKSSPTFIELTQLIERIEKEKLDIRLESREY